MGNTNWRRDPLLLSYKSLSLGQLLTTTQLQGTKPNTHLVLSPVEKIKRVPSTEEKKQNNISKKWYDITYTTITRGIQAYYSTIILVAWDKGGPALWKHNGAYYLFHMSTGDTFK